MKKLNFICLGNICRSPLAEAVMRKIIEDKGKQDSYMLDSSGVGDWHIGKPTDPRVASIGRSKGLRMDHLSKQLEKYDGDIYDYFFAMDLQTYDEAKKILGDKNQNKVMMFRTFDTLSESKEVVDPYYGTQSGFSQAYEVIERNCHILFEKLENKEI